MTKAQKVVAVCWGLAVAVCLLAVLAWGQSYRWQLAGWSLYVIFPLLGLLAYSLMWTHYIAGVIRRRAGLPQAAIKQYLSLTGYAVLVLILLHPGLLWYQLWRDGLGLPPASYLEHYVAPGLRWVAILGTISLVVFLAYELKPWFHQRRWWPAVVWAGNLAMVAIFYHGLRLGTQTQSGWYHWLWWLYGLSLVAALAFNYYVDNRASKAVKEE